MLIFFIDITLTSMVSYLMISHWAVGWIIKKDEILSSLSGNSPQIYLQNFQGSNYNLVESQEEFKKFYLRWYGRRFLVFPMFILVAISLFNAECLGETASKALDVTAGKNTDAMYYFALPKTAALSIAGAYAFVVWDLTIRVAKRNLAISDILGASVRLAIAVPLGYAFNAIIQPEISSFISFAVGAFPLQTVQTMLQRIANKQLKLEMGADSANDQVTKLSGIDQPTADRIEEADITTIAQLAYCDPVLLSMRTRLKFSYISDIVGQSLAWIYFGSYLDKLRIVGLRGAVEISALYELSLSRIDQGQLEKDLLEIFNSQDDQFLTRLYKDMSICNGSGEYRNQIIKFLEGKTSRGLLNLISGLLDYTNLVNLRIIFSGQEPDKGKFCEAFAVCLAAAADDAQANANIIIENVVSLIGSGDPKQALVIGKAGVLNAMQEITEDPYTIFLVATW